MKFSIVKIPDEVPPKLYGPVKFQPGSPNVQKYVVVHEFEAETGTEARAYFRKYETRWERTSDVEPTQLTYEVQQGDIHVNAIWVLHMTSEALLLAVDCAQKRPEYAVDYDADDGVLEILLHDKEDNGRGDQTSVEVLGLSGDWHLIHEWGKWGPRIALLKEGHEHISLEKTAR